ncbi:MAG: PQQ-binding-like beta-propeller repeat protein [Planctomycetaceae bacterium]
MSRTLHRMQLRVVLCALFMAVQSITHAEDWAGWRGPQRNDVSSESSLWDEGAWESLEVAWTMQVGEGASSPVVADGKLYVMGWAEDRETVTCAEAATGKTLWEHSYPAPRYGRKANGDEGLYSGPTSTPELDVQTGLLYTLGCDGELRCWNTRQGGAQVWAKNLYDAYDIPQRPKVGRSGLRDYGFTSSPLISGEVLIVEAGAKTGTLFAFNKQTGSEVWRSQATDPPGHTGGPVPFNVDGVPCVAVHSFAGLLVARLDTGHEGETVCMVPWITDFANNVATPAAWENNVITTSSYNQHRIARYEISLTDGAKQIWEREEASKVCSPIVHDGHVYWAWRMVHCVDVETGKTVWNGGPLGDPGSLILTADDRLILWANRGDLRIIETSVRSPKEYKQLFEQKNIAHKDAWPHVVLSEHRLVCKDRSGYVVCFELRGK